MKLLKPVLYLFTACSLTPTIQSQEYYDPTGESLTDYAPRVILTYVKYFEISTLDLADIMSTLGTSTNDTKLRAELLAKAKAGKATILESQTLTSRSEERATSESITEFIYPTKYDVDLEEDEKKPLSKAVVIIPTAFETRNLRATLLVEPILAEDGAIPLCKTDRTYIICL